MINKKLIEMLSTYPKDAVVKIFDADSEEMEPVTGLLSSTAHNTLELCSDAL